MPTSIEHAFTFIKYTGQPFLKLLVTFVMTWLVLPLVAWLTVGSCLSQSLQCPSYPLANVSRRDNDTLEFAPFPADSPTSEVNYNPGGLGPWYSIASGIINVARPGSVTKGTYVHICFMDLVSFSCVFSHTSLSLSFSLL